MLQDRIVNHNLSPLLIVISFAVFTAIAVMKSMEIRTSIFIKIYESQKLSLYIMIHLNLVHTDCLLEAVNF